MSGHTVLAGLARLVLLVFSAVFIASLVVAGLLLLVATVVWSLLRGRKPAVFHLVSQLRETSRRYRNAAAGFARPGTQAASADIVDVDAREVPGAHRLP